MAIEIRINKDGSSSYFPRIRDSNGKWFKTVAYNKKEDAEAEERRLLQSKESRAGLNFATARKTTVDEYWTVWAIDRRTETSEGWKTSQDQMYRDYIKPVLGTTMLAQVAAPEVGRVIARCKDLGKSPQMRKHVYSLMRKMFGDAVEYYELLDRSPVKPKHHRPRVPKSKRAFLTPEQSWQLVQASWSHEYLGPPVTVQILAALRCEAMMALTWDAVLWDSNQLIIKRAWKQKEGRMADYPKGKDAEYVPLTPVLKDYLFKNWQSLRPEPSDFVCQGVKGGMLPYETYLRALRRLCSHAQVPVVTPHELRHSCTELYVQEGACAEDIRRLLNHKSLGAVGAYIHRTDSRLLSLSNRVDNPKLRLVRVDNTDAYSDEQIGGLPSMDLAANLNKC